MTSTGKVYFTEEKNGYDREQVNHYIRMLSEAYTGVYNEYRALQGRYNGLLEKAGTPDTQARAGMDPEIAAKTLMNTEMLAQKIISEAQTEAAAAKAEARRAAEDASAAVEQAHAAADKIIGDANSEAGRILERAKKNLDQAHKTMGHAASEIYRLLTFAPPEREQAG
ncbi:MAG: hypothetical protein FWG93_02960 [Oscillospiraceae bacterium]|nr:hypothetical protein [Oscillospiraceae bacterium]